MSYLSNNCTVHRLFPLSQAQQWQNAQAQVAARKRRALTDAALEVYQQEGKRVYHLLFTVRTTPAPFLPSTIDENENAPCDETQNACG